MPPLSTTPAGNQAQGFGRTLLEFTVDASGTQEDLQLRRMQFEFQFPENSTLQIQNIHLEDENGVTVSTGIGGGGGPGFSSIAFSLNEQYVFSGSPRRYRLKADVLLGPGDIQGRSPLNASISEGGTLWSYDDVPETYAFDRYQFRRLDGPWQIY